jgi:arylsulfatase A-like enzyme
MKTFRAGLGVLIALYANLTGAVSGASAPSRPNILWITSEDHGPQLGCYGDPFAISPHIDKLAAKGMIYTRVWSCAPVCAPARTTLISGMYATSTGGEHMRSLVRFPAGKKMYPQLLRDAGYYCSNNSKEDYNLEPPGKVWDESSRQAHWRNRARGQPFFAVFNSEKSHESKIRTRPHTRVHDPAKVRIPAYHPDRPEVRQDWAQYYDIVTQADADAGKVLAELEADGLAEDTIVFYYGDHGSGMPRSKRWPYNSGLHVPLIVYIPDRFKHLRPDDYHPGGRSRRLVSFVDFAPSVLSLAGINPPSWMQGRAFLGRFPAPAPAFLHGFRGRMDERPDLIRSVTDGRYVYIRNYMPHLIYGQHLDYMWQTPTTRIWENLHRQQQLNAVQDAFWKPKPPEELYDLNSDRDEVVNLSRSPAHQKIKARLRNALRQQAHSVRDLGFIPEGERLVRARGDAPYDLGHDPQRYPFRRVFETAELASELAPRALPALRRAAADRDSAVRYWGILGILMRGTAAVSASRPELKTALQDPGGEVRIIAAQALAQFGNESDLPEALALLGAHAELQNHGVFNAIAALNSLDALGPKAAPLAQIIRPPPTNAPRPHVRYSPYVPRLVEDLKAKLEQRP